MSEPQKPQTSLTELCLLFLKIGIIGFGGPAAHIALMREEVVKRKKWVTEAEFLDYLGAVNLIPGPNSTELAIHVGYHRRGIPGLLVAGASFILPAMLIVWMIAWAYVAYGSLPEVSGLLSGIKPVIIAVVVQAIWGLLRTSVKTPSLAIVGIIALLLCAFGVDEILVLFIAGILAMLITKIRIKNPMVVAGVLLSGASSFVAKALAMVEAAGMSVSVSQIFWSFAKIGSVLFGSGYVLLAFLRTEFVEKFHWLSEPQLLDAISVGQFTPGPVFTTATFIGYVMAGNTGAVLATLGIFLPAFVFVALSAPLIPKLRSLRVVGVFLDGVNIGSLALMLVVTWHLGRGVLVDGKSLLLALISAIILIRYKVNSAWLILAGGLIGLAL